MDSKDVKLKVDMVAIVDAVLDDILMNKSQEVYNALVKQGWAPPTDNSKPTKCWSDPVC